MSTKISWTNVTWNPLVGCNQVSPGCAHCYAKALHDKRHKAYLAGKSVPPQYAQSFEVVQLKPERLDTPLHWKAPRRVFVNSVSDLFHESVPFSFIDRVFAVMALTPQHTYQILTKRPQVMQDYVRRVEDDDSPVLQAMQEIEMAPWRRLYMRTIDLDRDEDGGLADVSLLWPLPNVWLGTSVENQRWANERIPILMNTPAAVRFLSCEPLLGLVDLLAAMPLDHESDAWDEVNAEDWDQHEPEMEIEEAELEGDWINYGSDMVPNPEYREYQADRERRARLYMLRDGLQWIIAGGESGPGYRKMDLDWARSLRNQCVAAGVPFFFKQSSGFRSETGTELDGQVWHQYPGDLEMAAPMEAEYDPAPTSRYEARRK